MAGIGSALSVLEGFIAIGKELARLPALVLPQYKDCAIDMYRISQRLLQANENLAKWFYRFLYFDFRGANAQSDFLAAVRDYRTMKAGPGLQALKFSCHDIGGIYRQHIESKLGAWLTNQAKREEAQGLFEQLSQADGLLVTFIVDEFIGRVDRFVDDAEQLVATGSLDVAEQLRVKTRSESKELVARLEHFSGELSELVMSFATVAGIPISLSVP